MYNIYLYNISAKLCVYIKLNPSANPLRPHVRRASYKFSIRYSFSCNDCRKSSVRSVVSLRVPLLVESSVMQSRGGSRGIRECRGGLPALMPNLGRGMRICLTSDSQASMMCVCVCDGLVMKIIVCQQREREREKHQLKKKL